MKKLGFGFSLIVFCTLLTSPVFASEVTEDYLDIATNYCIQGNYKEAISYLEKIIVLEPNNKNVKDLKSDLLQIMNPNTKSYLTSHNAQIKQTVEFKKQGNKTKELAFLTNAITIDPKDYWSCYYLAEFHRDNNNFAQANVYYQKALSIKPSFSQCYLGMALGQYETKKYTETIVTLNNYLKYNQSSDFAYALRALANMNINEYMNAESDIVTAMSIRDDIDYKFIEGKILYHRGSYTGAKKRLEGLTGEIKTSEIYKYIGLCDYAMKNYPSALLNLDKAIILSDEDKSLNSKYNEIKEKLDK